VSTLWILTVAPETTAPEVSVTVPRTVPRKVCAGTQVAASSSIRTRSTKPLQFMFASIWRETVARDYKQWKRAANEIRRGCLKHKAPVGQRQQFTLQYGVAPGRSRIGGKHVLPVTGIESPVSHEIAGNAAGEQTQ